MRTNNLHGFLIALVLLAITVGNSYAQGTNQTTNPITSKNQTEEPSKYKVTFVELGSVRCIPCQQMQVVMKSIEKKYGKQVKVVFHDVWTPEGKPFGETYGIDEIPTQVFLDEKGKEFYRHVGFFPEEELIKVLKNKGIK